MIFVMFMCMNDILNVLIDIDDIPNYNYCIFLHFRCACIHLVTDVFTVGDACILQ